MLKSTGEKKRHKTLLCCALYFFLLRYSIYTVKGTILSILPYEFSQTVHTMLFSTCIKKVNTSTQVRLLLFSSLAKSNTHCSSARISFACFCSFFYMEYYSLYILVSVWLLSFTIMFMGFLCVVNIAILCSFSLLFNISF